MEYEVGDFVALKDGVGPFSEGFITSVAAGGSATKGPIDARFEVTSPTGRVRITSGKDIAAKLDDPQLEVGGDYHVGGSLAQVTKQEGRVARLRFGSGYHSYAVHHVVIGNRGAATQG